MTDRPIDIARGRARARDRSPFPGAVLTVGVCIVLVGGIGSMLAPVVSVWVALTLFIAASAVMLAGLRQYPHAEFGAANMVTLVRLALVAVLVAVLATPGVPPPAAAWGVPAVAAVAFAFDGVDGWLARRAGLVSGFGARFDMEVDCALALVLALLALDSGKVGVGVLALGLARYVFWAASLALPWMRGELPERRSRKIVCVAQIAVLIALVSPAVGPSTATALAAGALAFVGWSFAVDVRHLYRGHR